MDSNKYELRTLAETQSAFTDWRMKNKKGETIPDELWEKALALLAKYTLSKVAGCLRLDASCLRKRATEAAVTFREKGPATKARKPKPKPKPKQNTFIEVVLPGDDAELNGGQSDATLKGWRISLTRNDGTRLEIMPPEFTDAQLQALICGFLGG